MFVTTYSDYMKKGLLLLLLCTFIIQSNARTRTLPKTVLDQATVTVYYRFTQQATVGTTIVELTDTTILRIGSIYSVYFNRSSILRDSVFSATFNSIDRDQIRSIQMFPIGSDDAQRAIDNMMGGLDFISQPNPETTRIFKNRQTHLITSIDGDFDSPLARTSTREMFLVEEIIPPMEWEIFPDTMTILSYLCFKATTTFRGRKYIAWFTLDIPINEGPWKIYGLPGLILRLEDADGLFVHKAVGLTSHASKPIVINAGTYTIASNAQLQRWIENGRNHAVRRTGFSRGTLMVVGIRNELNFHRREIGN